MTNISKSQKNSVQETAIKRQTEYGNKNCKDKVWKNAKTIRGKDKELYRKDPYGNELYYHSYGTNANGEKSWQIDHIKHQSRGGSDNIRNLQALQSKINMSKGNTLIKKSRHNN